MAYSAPPDQVVYEEDTAAVTLLSVDPSTYRRVRLWPSFVGRFPFVWRQFPVGQRSNDDGIAFLHERQSLGGRRRLVIIGIRVYGHNDRHVVALTETVVCPATQNRPPDVARHQIRAEVLVDFNGFSDEGRLRLYAGQPDPTDASHLTIGYELDGKKGMIDCWLQDDDTVEMKVRDGPAKSP